MLTVLLGGARSGKSALAERLADARGGHVTYVATCPRIDGDDDLVARIARHRSDRPSGWTTIEEELELSEALVQCGDDTVIVDCLTTWVSNLMHRGDDEEAILRTSAEVVGVAGARAAATIVVSNEVGLGIVPAAAGVRSYRDLLGRVNQQWVTTADRAVLLVAGRALDLHPPESLL